MTDTPIATPRWGTRLMRASAFALCAAIAACEALSPNSLEWGPSDRYFLITIDGDSVPAMTVDAKGDSVRVYEDQLDFSNSDSTYTEKILVGRMAGSVETVGYEQILKAHFTRSGRDMQLPTLIAGPAKLRLSGTPWQTVWILDANGLVTSNWSFSSKR